MFGIVFHRNMYHFFCLLPLTAPLTFRATAWAAGPHLPIPTGPGQVLQHRHADPGGGPGGVRHLPIHLLPGAHLQGRLHGAGACVAE